MRNPTRTLLTCALLLAAPALLAQPPEAPPTSKALVAALQSGDLDAQADAMQTYIAHSEHFDLRPAKFDVVRLYRDHTDPDVRLLALATLHAMQESWTMDFLLRSIDYEKDPKLQRLTRHVAYSYYYPDLVDSTPPALAVAR